MGYHSQCIGIQLMACQQTKPVMQRVIHGMAMATWMTTHALTPHISARQPVQPPAILGTWPCRLRRQLGLGTSITQTGFCADGVSQQ